ncbi:hypothetical protein Bbelb_277150 [Branchiostoma belcheri]|nr:hypothetical protein Bbelb_277150 [Branchiostoma belcheri]
MGCVGPEPSRLPRSLPPTYSRLQCSIVGCHEDLLGDQLCQTADLPRHPPHRHSSYPHRLHIAVKPRIPKQTKATHAPVITGYNLRHGMARHIRWWEESISRDAQTLSTRGGEISRPRRPISRIAQTNSTSSGPISRARGYFSRGTALSGVSQLLPVTVETPTAR